MNRIVILCVGLRLPTEAKYLSLLHSVQTSSEVPFPDRKAPGT
jgi:hypothetical protein